MCATVVVGDGEDDAATGKGALALIGNNGFLPPAFEFLLLHFGRTKFQTRQDAWRAACDLSDDKMVAGCIGEIMKVAMHGGREGATFFSDVVEQRYACPVMAERAQGYCHVDKLVVAAVVEKAA